MGEIIQADAPLFHDPVSPEMDQSLTKAIEDIQKDKKGQLALDVTLEGAKLAVGHKFNANWAASAWVGYDWTGEKQAGVRLRGAW